MLARVHLKGTSTTMPSARVLPCLVICSGNTEVTPRPRLAPPAVPRQLDCSAAADACMIRCEDCGHLHCPMSVLGRKRTLAFLVKLDAGQL